VLGVGMEHRRVSIDRFKINFAKSALNL